MTNTCSRKQKCHKLRKVRLITSEMNFVPQWHISNMNTIFQKTIDETNLSPYIWQKGARTKFDLASTIFRIFYSQPAQMILSWCNALQSPFCLFEEDESCKRHHGRRELSRQRHLLPSLTEPEFSSQNPQGRKEEQIPNKLYSDFPQLPYLHTHTQRDRDTETQRETYTHKYFLKCVWGIFGKYRE